MIALVRDVATGKPTGIHRTALADECMSKRQMPDGTSAKMLLGRATGSAVMLFKPASCMGIAEGIETALSAARLFEIPVWAVMSAVGMSAFPLLGGVERLTIFADHDAAGVKAAEQCANRYARVSIGGEIRYPPKPGSDWNNWLTLRSSK